MLEAYRGYKSRSDAWFETDEGRFCYEVVANNYVMITGYRGGNGALTFADGYCWIHVPETIEGLPVLKIAPLCLDLKLWGKAGGGSYAHNGSTRVMIKAPEYASFEGLQPTRIDCYSVFTPSHRLQYYKRTEELLRETVGNVTFLAKPLPDGTCAIIFMSTEHTELQDNVWDPVPKNNSLEVEIPASVKGRSVAVIAEGASLGLYSEAPVSLHIPDPVVCLEEDNFNGLPFLAEVHLGRGLRGPGKNIFNFFQEEDEERLKKVPPLKVFHYGGAFAQTDTEFSRRALAVEYEDYSDWGYMRVGQHNVQYPVEFIRLD